MFRRPITILIVAWGSCVALGVSQMLTYELTPAPPAAIAATWPRAASLDHDPSRPTLILFLHPHCPCSRATLAELDRLAATCGGQFALRIAFVQPPGMDSGWEHTDLFRSAQRIPDAIVWCDVDGAEAARFGAVTSGQAMLYATDGRLLFQGGLTPSRGHEGDNAGRSAVASLIATGRSHCTHTEVYGCSLVDRH